MGEESVPLAALLAEYHQIKEEQKTRIGFRDNLLYVTLAATIGTLVAALQAGRHAPLLLLLLPVAVTALGWTYLVNDNKISAMGRYIRTSLGPRMNTLTQLPLMTFGWEHFHREDGRRTQRRSIQCAVDLAVFTGIPAVALIACWFKSGDSTPMLVASVIEAAAVATLATQIISYTRASH
ncbi:hypothetical protein ACFVIM_24460 [Streptomyces sp. NPDC057638]|uniref:hypothetical protein n=1 Tax=Streptomyces sp. NPDC057638 TaxID=3346190 RepID=UPI00369DE885